MMLLIGMSYTINIVLSGGIDEEHPALNEASLKTDYLLKYAKEDLSKHYFETSLYHIESAIEVMKLMERDTDSEADKAIEMAIKDLRDIENRVTDQDLSEKEINFVFAKALNSVAYAHLRLSEGFSERGEHEEAANALKLSINHLENAMLFSTGKYKKLEYNVFVKIDSLIQLEQEDPVLFLSMVKDVVQEVDTALLNREYSQIMESTTMKATEESKDFTEKEKHKGGEHH